MIGSPIASPDEFAFQVLTLQFIVFAILAAQIVWLYFQIKLFFYFRDSFRQEFPDESRTYEVFFHSLTVVVVSDSMFFAIWSLLN
jgi:hypothetical protein